MGKVLEISPSVTKKEQRYEKRSCFIPACIWKSYTFSRKSAVFPWKSLLYNRFVKGKYKEGGGSEDEGELEKWLKTIKEILDDPQPDAIDFLDTIKLNLFASEIFVFTPKGELKTMPQNSTALDFAFSLHTDIGSHCIGAKVNHKLVPLSHKLQSGDQVEILTSKNQRVQPQWEVFEKTARARAKIAAILRK